MRRLRLFFPSLLLLLTLSHARADLAPGAWFRNRPTPGPVVPPAPPQPQAPKVEKMPLVIEIDNRVRIPRLQIPKKLLQGGAAAAPAGINPAARRAEAPAEEPRQYAEDPSRLPTVVAGVALSLGFVSAGLWLVRRRASRRAAAAGAVLGLLILGGAALWADVPVFPRPQPPVPPPAPPQPAPAANLPQLVLPAGILLPGNVNVEVVEKGEAIKLIVNKNMVLKAAGVRPAQPPGAAAPSEEE